VSVALAGRLRLSARAGRLEISGCSRVVAVVSDGVMLSASRTFETVDCRGPRRFTAMHGAESLGLGFIPDGAERSCPVLELSLAGASVLAVDAQELPGVGDRVSGSLVFLDQGLVRIEAEVRHVNRVTNGLRVGLSFREFEAGECSVSDVVDALAT
jgi:hypothetical protein